MIIVCITRIALTNFTVSSLLQSEFQKVIEARIQIETVQSIDKTSEATMKLTFILLFAATVLIAVEFTSASPVQIVQAIAEKEKNSVETEANHSNVETEGRQQNVQPAAAAPAADDDDDDDEDDDDDDIEDALDDDDGSWATRKPSLFCRFDHIFVSIC